MEKKKLPVLKKELFSNEQTVPVSFKETLRNLADSSSLHGIPKIVSSRQVAVKVLWCLLFVGTFIVFTLQLYQLFRAYYSFPIKTTVSLQYSPIAFPAVTFCNMNPVRKSKLSMSGMVNSVLTPEKGKEQHYSRRRRDATAIKPLSRDLYLENEVLIGSASENPFEEKQTPNIRPSGVGMNYPYALLKQNKTGHGDDSNLAPFSRVVLQPSPSVITDVHRHRRQIVNGVSKVMYENSDTITTVYSTKSKTKPSAETDGTTTETAGTSSETDGKSADTENSSGTKTATSSETDGKSTNTENSSGTKTAMSSETDGKSADTENSSGTKTETSSETDGKSTNTENSSGTKTATSSKTDGKSADTESSSGTKTATSSETDGKTKGNDDTSSTKTESGSLDKWTAWYNDYLQKLKEEETNQNSLLKGSYNWSSGDSAGSTWSNWHNPKGYVLSQMFSKKDEWDDRIDLFRTALKEENITYRRQMGHQKEDMILSASFAGILENSTSYQALFSSEYGNCFTMSSADYVAWRSGPSHGIKLTVNLEIDEYVPKFSTGYGLRVLLHEPGTYPLPSNEGVTLSPGTETNIGLRMVRISRLAEPHGNCVDGKEFAERYKKKYSKAVCFQVCRISKTIDDCKCVPVDSPDEFEISPSAAELPVCNITKDSVKACLLGVDIDFNYGKYECDCDGPCKETMYEMTMSSRFWPMDDYLDVLMDEMCTENYTAMSAICENKENLTYDQTEKYRKNFLRVIIYYEDLNYESITQEPMYEGVRFLSDIGGAMGLFLGASVLSFVEFLQLLLEIFLLISRKIFGDSNRVESIK